MNLQTKLKYLWITAVLLVSITILNYWHISKISQDFIYSNLEEIPYNRVGLLLGTSHLTREGFTNPFFKNRIEAAANLYKNKKIDYIIVSGDNSDLRYNEPEKMKQALLNKNIPESAIYTDYAGFSTLDSIIRANQVFGQNKYTIISQKFHNQRAIFISQNYNIDAIAFNAEAVHTKTSFRIYIRETLARIKARIDVFLNNKPKFLGEPIQIKNKYDYQI